MEKNQKENSRIELNHFAVPPEVLQISYTSIKKKNYRKKKEAGVGNGIPGSRANSTFDFGGGVLAAPTACGSSQARDQTYATADP